MGNDADKNQYTVIICSRQLPDVSCPQIMVFISYTPAQISQFNWDLRWTLVLHTTRPRSTQGSHLPGRLELFSYILKLNVQLHTAL